jgi:hypothetical protein
MLIGAAVLVVVGLVASVFVLRRGKGEGDWSADDYADNKLDAFEDQFVSQTAAAVVPGNTFETPSAGPSRPPQNHTGQMQDGYEVCEFPPSSGKWWYRDQTTGQWTKWE